MFGWLKSGFTRKLLARIRGDLYTNLRSQWRDDIDLSDDSLPAMALQVIAIELMVVWKAVEAVFYSRYTGTARGIGLDHLAQRLMLPRRGERKATGVLKGTGVEGAVITAGELVRHNDGTGFVVAKNRTVPASGYIDIPVEARASGIGGNKAVNSTWLLMTGEVELSGARDERDAETFAVESITGYEEMPVGERFDTLQEIAVGDLHYPITLDGLALQVKNATDSEQLYFIYLSVRDKTTGADIGQTQIRKVLIAAGSSQALAFTGQGLDVSAYTAVEVSFVLAEGSTGALSIGVNNTAPYGGKFRLGGTAHSDKDAWLRLTTVAAGMTTGGRTVESGVEFAARQRRSVAKAGAGIPKAIESNLWSIDGVRHVKVDWNPTLELDGRGVEPKSVRITVAGGRIQDIGQMVLERGVGAGIATCGSDTISVPCPTGGQTIPVSIERPSEVSIYVRVRVIPEFSGALSDDFVTNAKRAIIAYIGGGAGDGTYWPGLPAGGNVSIAQMHGAVVRFAGVTSALIRISKTGIPVSDTTGQGTDLAISSGNPVEIAITKEAYIEVM